MRGMAISAKLWRVAARYSSGEPAEIDASVETAFTKTMQNIAADASLRISMPRNNCMDGRCAPIHDEMANESGAYTRISNMECPRAANHVLIETIST